MLNQRLCCLHPNIIQLHEVFLTPEHLAIVSELAPGGDLVDYIERHSMTHECALQENAARWLFQQLIVAVDYCHQVICTCYRTPHVCIYAYGLRLCQPDTQAELVPKQLQCECQQHL